MSTEQLTQLNIPGLPYSLAMHTHGEEDLVSSMIERDKIWEAFETELVIRHIKSDDIVLDVGANIGYYTLVFSKLVGAKGKVLAFEPEQQNFDLLQKNIQLNQLENVQANHAGLGEASSSEKLFINETNRGDHRSFTSDSSITATEIQILKGDELVPEQVSFIKLDTQGYELRILKGLRNTINKNQQHLKMIVEFWPYALEKNGGSAHALIDELTQYDFTVSIIDHINHQLITSDWNALKTLVNNELCVENQGFINLFFEPKI